MNQNQPTTPQDPLERLLPRDLQPAVLPEEVADANLTDRTIHEFSGAMAAKMQRYQGRFKISWFNRSWTKNELDLEIARCVMDCDYVSAANYSMMAHHFQDQAAGPQCGNVKAEGGRRE